jgi:uncharacterized protein (DUF58 family)
VTRPAVKGTKTPPLSLVNLRTPRQAEPTLRQLEVVVTRRLDGLLHGDFRGLVPGAGTEPGEGREYRAGDDVRRMDWNLTARTGIAHVREAVADRELETWLVVDQSASLNFGTAMCEKRELAIAAAAAFAFLTARSGNRTGAVTIGGHGNTVLPARSGRDAALALLHRLSSAPRTEDSDRLRAGSPAPAGATLATALHATARTARRRGLVAVISDFLGPADWKQALGHLALRHQVVAVEIRDPREDELPAVGLLTLVDPETGQRVEVQTSREETRRQFAEAATSGRPRLVSVGRHRLRGVREEKVRAQTLADFA